MKKILFLILMSVFSISLASRASSAAKGAQISLKQLLKKEQEECLDYSVREMQRVGDLKPFHTALFALNGIYHFSLRATKDDGVQLAHYAHVECNAKKITEIKAARKFILFCIQPLHNTVTHVDQDAIDLAVSWGLYYINTDKLAYPALGTHEAIAKFAQDYRLVHPCITQAKDQKSKEK